MTQRDIERMQVTVMVREDLRSAAAGLGIDLSAVFETAIEAAVAEAKRKSWIEENREAFESSNRFVEEHGLFSDGRRLF